MEGMRISLCAISKEETPALSAISIATYVHATKRRKEVSAFFFPPFFLDSFEGKTQAILNRVATRNQILLGVGIRQKNEDVYALFLPDGSFQIVQSKALIRILDRDFHLYFGKENMEEFYPRVVLGKRNHEASFVQEKSLSPGETYYLGPCQEGCFEAFVFESGAVKCQLPLENGNILVKSVPSS